ncbi:hypothetical protein [Rhodococcus erythropolis]|uniref:hypothetical protein n=1 Tax=Rhodococcus erythropolis TaxID=1833 RepID=UPI001BEBADB9|nr:hypothetical protein [Rhodococcus erythropolis]MBT2266395.1 hypothetical protein [Rhodococcus erythropolis]
MRDLVLMSNREREAEADRLLALDPEWREERVTFADPAGTAADMDVLINGEGWFPDFLARKFRIRR